MCLVDGPMLDVVNVNPPVGAAWIRAFSSGFVDEKPLERGFDLSLMLRHDGGGSSDI